MYTDFFTLTLVNYFRLNNFLYKNPQLKPSLLLFDVIADKVHTFNLSVKGKFCGIYRTMATQF